MDRPWQHTTRAKGIIEVLVGNVMFQLLVTPHRTVMMRFSFRRRKVGGVVAVVVNRLARTSCR
jgi:hypothetical protein